MLVEVIIVCLLAKLRHYKLKYLFHSWTFYPVLAVQMLLLFLQFSVFFEVYSFLSWAAYTEAAVILSFLGAMFVFQLYKPAICGSACIVGGTLLNNFVMAQNGGLMPVFPSLSYLTGYIPSDLIGSLDQIHVLGSAAANCKILTDYIDYGYCILSPGDVLIHLFACIMLFCLIAAVNKKYDNG